jgi:hypothetical protein
MHLPASQRGLGCCCHVIGSSKYNRLMSFSTKTSRFLTHLRDAVPSFGNQHRSQQGVANQHVGGRISSVLWAHLAIAFEGSSLASFWSARPQHSGESGLMTSGPTYACLTIRRELLQIPTWKWLVSYYSGWEWKGCADISGKNESHCFVTIPPQLARLHALPPNSQWLPNTLSRPLLCTSKSNLPAH